MAEGSAETPRAGRIAAAAVLLMSSVLLSRLLGYGREVLLAYRAGAGAATDAYYAAFQIPDLLNYLLAGGALSIAFVPLYMRHLARNDHAGAERLFATVLGTLGVLAVVATALLWWYAEALVALQFPRFDPATRALTTHLTRIVLPAQVFFIIGGIVNATLLARGRFRAAAAAPLLYNGSIIAGGLFLAPHLSSPVEGFSWGALAGAVLGPFLAPLIDARGRVRIRLRLAPADRAFLGYLAVAAPLMLGQTLLTVDEFYGRWFGALLGTGTVAHLSYARRLMLIPVAAVGQALATAALPALSRLWAEGRRRELDHALTHTLRIGIWLAMIGAGAFLVLAHPLVRVIYQHGAFTSADTTIVAGILAVLALAVPAWILQQIATRAFYARGDTWRPMLLGTAVAALAIPLYLSFGKQFGVLGLAWAGVIGMTANALATILLARGLHGAPDLSVLGGTALRAVFAAAAGSVAALFLGGNLGQSGVFGALVHLVTGGVAFAGAVVAAAWLAGDELLRETLRRFVTRLR